MVKKNISLWQYSIPLREPLTIPNGSLPRREGLLFAFLENEQICGIGEIAPLSGLHTETLDEAQHQTLSCIPALLNNSLVLDDLFPSVRCGIEMAMWSLQKRNEHRIHASLLPLNALISGAKDSIVRLSEEAVQDGYTTLKIKVGRHSLEDDCANIRSVRKSIGKDIALRLDANRSWSLETALRLGEAISDCNISYIEEPLRHWHEIPLFFERTGIRVALDEMLYSTDKTERLQRKEIPSETLAAYILKPSVIGSIETASSLAQEAAVRGLDAVVSSVFESGVALGMYAALQASWNNGLYAGRMIACGLDTYKFLGEDVLVEAFNSNQGLVQIPRVFDACTFLRPEVCSPIYHDYA
jgi:o-succinylbenzoate synthase